jgi:glycosyltransferase involved in cell wall biosynthesis
VQRLRRLASGGQISAAVAFCECWILTTVSVLVPVKNEIANIRECLRGLEFADEIVVVDSASTDGTIAAAEEMGARVVQFKWDGKFPRKRNWSLENVPWRHEWILIVDADERIPPPLAEEITQAIKQPKYDGYYLNRRFWFLGGWIRHCGYFPSWNIRFFRRGLVAHRPLRSRHHQRNAIGFPAQEVIYQRQNEMAFSRTGGAKKGQRI